MVNISRVFYKVMSAVCPPSVRNMTLLDRSRFECNIQIPLLEVQESSLSSITKLIKKYMLKMENFKPIQPAPTTTNDGVQYKLIYLNPNKVNQWLDFSEADRTKLVENSVHETALRLQTITLTYENWRIGDIFKAVLPEGEDVVSGFSHIGHIVHLNLRDHLLPYRYLIGQVLLDKIKICRTVVNKSNNIDNTYRNFTMEVISGEENFEVTVKENCCIFQFDFSKVYWNPRLGKEHERIIKLLKPGDVLFDVFCGVGPFAIPAAKKKCIVFANDLNPESYKWLNHNAKQNKVQSQLFKSYNLDGRNFITEHFKSYMTCVLNGSVKMNNGAKIQLTMNLPAIAFEFLDSFNGLLKDVALTNDNVTVQVIVHVYCFVPGDSPDVAAKALVNKNLGVELTSDKIVEVFKVRNVAPNKEMMRVTFKLTKCILMGNIVQFSEEAEPLTKKRRP